MMIDWSSGERREQRAFRGYLGVTGIVRIANECIGIGDVEVVANQSHAEWRVEIVEKDAAGLRHTVAIRVPQ